MTGLSGHDPAWSRYTNEPNALWTIMLLHREEIGRDPGNADWYRNEIAEIDARLEVLS